MDVEKMEIQKAFQLLRPVCVTLTTVHSLDNVMKLTHFVNILQPDVLQMLQQYVVFPLQMILKKSEMRNQQVYIETINCLCLILDKTEVQNVSLFLDIFNTLCLTLTSKDNIGKVAVTNSCEEIKISTVKAVSSLIKSASLFILEEVYQPQFLPPLGHCVTLLLAMSESEESRQLKILSMKCIADLALRDRKVSSDQTTLVSQFFASFLPGITISLSKIITGDTKVGHQVITTAIITWHQIVELVLSDKNIIRAKPECLSTNSSAKYTSLMVDRSEKWVKSTAVKLHVLIGKIKEKKNNSEWRIRIALVEWAGVLLNNCTCSLAPCIPDFLEVLASVLHDEYPNVVTKSQKFLQMVVNKNVEQKRQLHDILMENLHQMSIQLPRLMRTADEQCKASTILLFNGYLKLLSKDIDKLLNSSSHLQKISLALIQVLELDCSSIGLIVERSTSGEGFTLLESNSQCNLPAKCFKHFNNNSIYKYLSETCHLLGRHGNPDVLFDHFIELFYRSRLYRKQVVLIITLIGQGVLSKCKNNSATENQLGLDDIMRSLLELFLDREYFTLQTKCSATNQISSLSNTDTLQYEKHLHLPLLDTSNESIKKSQSLSEINSNILQICLLLEGIGMLIKILGADHKFLMMDVLYPVLEKVGHENSAISNTAYYTLTVIAEVYQYDNVNELIKANSSYLVNSISLRMRHLEQNPSTPVVLSVILNHSNQDILPKMEDTIAEVLKAVDNYYEDLGYLLMKVLQTMAIAIRKWNLATSHQQLQKEVQHPNKEDRLNSCSKVNVAPSSDSMADRITAFISQHLIQRRIAEGEDIHDTTDVKNVSDAEDSGHLDSEDMKKEVPYHVEKMKQISEKCVHLLCSKDTRVRMITLDTVSEVLLALHPYENELLPIVHQLWSPFILRIKDQETIVVLKAFTVLQTFASVSRDFIRQRVMKDVFPKMIDILTKQSSVSLKAGPIYHHSMACKLQVRILEQIGEMCHLVGIGENQLTSVIQACIPYLSARQPKILQKACVKTFAEFQSIEPDIVWLLLKKVYSPTIFQHKNQCFSPINFKSEESDINREFVQNINYILSKDTNTLLQSNN